MQPAIRLDNHTLKSASDWLCEQDKVLSAVIEKHGYPPLWAREPGFATLIHIILEQQVSLASAAAAFQKLKNRMGTIEPDKFLTINDVDLLQIGFSRQKKIYVRTLAEAVLKGEFVFELLPAMGDEALRIYMKRLKGIGDWTVDVYSLMCLLRPDVLPKGDIALYESFRVLYGQSQRPNHDSFKENTRHWQPWRSVGARILWHHYLCERRERG